MMKPTIPSPHFMNQLPQVADLSRWMGCKLAIGKGGRIYENYKIQVRRGPFFRRKPKKEVASNVFGNHLIGPMSNDPPFKAALKKKSCL